MGTVTDLAALPTADHITLLFKKSKSTVLLSVSPEQSFESIKELLLNVLKSRNLSTLPNSIAPLPDDATHIEFGILKEKKDPSKGWIALEQKQPDQADTKAAKKKGLGKAGSSNDTPGGAGLTDGSIVAYRLREDRPEQESEYDMMDVDEDPGWDVVLPIYEDDIDADT